MHKADVRQSRESLSPHDLLDRRCIRTWIRTCDLPDLPLNGSREPGSARLFADSAAPGVRPPAGPAAARPLGLVHRARRLGLQALGTRGEAAQQPSARPPGPLLSRGSALRPAWSPWPSTQPECSCLPSQRWATTSRETLAFTVSPRTACHLCSADLRN